LEFSIGAEAKALNLEVDSTMSKNGGFQKVQKGSVPKVKCDNPRGCLGQCPLNAVIRSNKKEDPSAVPATCFECGRKYKVPPGFGSPGPQQNNAKGNEVSKLRAEIDKLRAELKAKPLETSSAKSDEADMEVDSEDAKTKEARAKVKLLDKKLRDTKGMPETLHDLLPGGYEAAVQELQQQLDQARAALRESKPLDSRRASADAYLKKTTREAEQADADFEVLQKKAKELQEQLAAQEALRQKKLTALEEAKKQVADLAGTLLDPPEPSSKVPGEHIFAHEEANLLRGIFSTCVDDSRVDQVCKRFGLDKKMFESCAVNILGKMDAQVAAAVPAAETQTRKEPAPAESPSSAEEKAPPEDQPLGYTI
jgi:hypothetical protein